MFYATIQVEDYDDLVAVLSSQAETLNQRHGEFFIADLISSQNESNYTLVADV